MNDRDRRRYERLTRVQSFGHERANEFTPQSSAIKLFGVLDRRRDELDIAKASQMPERIDKRVLIRSLTDTCKLINRTARVFAQQEGGLAGSYRVPLPVTEGNILTHSDALLMKLEDQPDDQDAAKAAKQTLRERFIAYELPPTFVQTLRQKRETLRDAIQLNQVETQDGVENTALIGKILDAAATDVKALDALMINKYSEEPEKLSAWRSASRIEAAPRRTVKKAVGEIKDVAPPVGGVA